MNGSTPFDKDHESIKYFVHQLGDYYSRMYSTHCGTRSSAPLKVMPNYRTQKQETKGICAQLKPGGPSSNTAPVKITYDFGKPPFRSPDVWQRTLPFRPKPKDYLARQSVKLNLYGPRGEKDDSGTPTSLDLPITHSRSSEVISNVFAASANSVLRRLDHLLIVAIDFVCGPQPENDAAAWKGIRVPHRTWLRRLHSWRDGTGILAAKIIEQVLDKFGHQDDETEYAQTRRTAFYFWFRICEIAREVESLTVPAASNFAAFRARCREFFLLCSHAWDSLEISIKYDVKAFTGEAALLLEV
jgi:hypothetical protein